MPILVDSNVILDIFTEDNAWYSWSSEAIATYAASEGLVINPIIYAEVSIRFSAIEDLEKALPHHYFRRESLPWEAGFLAGKCFQKYRRQRGQKLSPLPDFYIGAHAAVAGMPLLTRDLRKYQTYFPKLRLISPND